MTPHAPDAVLFDLDGTLVDTEPYWMTAELELIDAYGAQWTEQDAHGVIGFAIPDTARVMQSKGVDLETDEIVRRLGQRVGELLLQAIPWRPGAHELLTELHGAGVPLALVTMSYTDTVRAILAGLSINPFTTLVTGDRVTHGKPDPEPYLTAASELGVDPAACVAVEDSPTGLASAIASGAAPIFVPNILSVAPSDAFTTWPTLAGRQLTDLAQVSAAHRARGYERSDS